MGGPGSGRKKGSGSRKSGGLTDRQKKLKYSKPKNGGGPGMKSGKVKTNKWAKEHLNRGNSLG